MAEEFRPQICQFALSSDQVAAGGNLVAWFAFANRGGLTGAEDTVFVHVRPASADNADTTPATGADFRPFVPTYLWLRDTVVMEDARAIAIPADFPPGRYNLFVGLYDAGTGERVALANEDLATPDRRCLLATFDVLPAGAAARGKVVEHRYADMAAMRSVWQTLEEPVGTGEIALEGGRGRVVLSAGEPRVLRYELPNGATIEPGRRAWPVRARYFRSEDATYRSVRLEAPDFTVARPAGPSIVYSATVRDGGRVAARFDVRFTLEDDSLTATVEDVAEEPGYLLMDVYLPPLLGAHGPDGALVVPNDAGRLLDLSRVGQGQLTMRMDWYVGDLCAAAVQGSAAAVCRTRNWDNELLVTTAGAEGARAGDVVPRFALRAEAKGNAAKTLLADRSSVEIGLVPLDGADLDAAWVAAAKWLRRDLTGGPSPIYRDCLVYKVFCDSPGAGSFTTYDDALGIIRTAHRLAPWQKQVVYLVGWQYEGHDTGYPATDVLNPRLGTIEDLRRVASGAAELGAVVSFHDNFDDAYRTSPQWDESVIAHNDSDELCAGGVWAGGQSYILACAKYAERYGSERVRRTLAQMPVRESYHIDVLSAVPIRRDYHPEAPESTEDGLRGKLAIIHEFNRAGIDVTSEGFTAPFVGAIGHAWHFWHRPTVLIEGERPIPFLSFVYHGGPTSYGNGAQSDHYAQDSALYGAGFSTDWTKGVNPRDMAWSIYEVNVPWAALRERRMESFTREGAVSTVTYDPDTFVRVDSETGAWRVVVDGKTLVEDDLVVVRKPGLLALFSPTARETTVMLPPDLRGVALRATDAVAGADIPLAGRQVGDSLTLSLPAMTPVLVEAAAR